MKIVLGALFAVFFAAGPCHAQMVTETAVLTPIASAAQHLTSISSATALTVPAGAKGAWITADNNASFTQAVNCTDDGTTPTATVGHTVAAGQSVFIKLVDLSVIKCIQQGASGAIFVSYYK